MTTNQEDNPSQQSYDKKSYKTAIIINPNSGNGATGKRLNSLKDLLKGLGDFEINLTERKAHAIELTRHAILNGFNRIIAVGGDGTINETVNGFFENEKIINPDAILGFIPCGTGSDFVRTINLPPKENKIIEKIINSNTQTIDLGKSTFQLDSNSQKTRFFINVANIGLGGEVVDRVNKTTKAFGGFASFLTGTILTVFEYKNKMVEITFDDSFKMHEIMNNIVIGNGCFCGGGMKFLPDAKLDDGWFDVLTIGDINKLDFFKQIPKVYSGSHIDGKKINVRKAKKIVINSSDKLKVDLDGEQEGYTSASFEILPKILKIIV